MGLKGLTPDILLLITCTPFYLFLGCFLFLSLCSVKRWSCLTSSFAINIANKNNIAINIATAFKIGHVLKFRNLVIIVYL